MTRLNGSPHANTECFEPPLPQLSHMKMEATAKLCDFPRLPLGVSLLYKGTICCRLQTPTERDDNRARKSTGTANQVWSPGGVQTPNFGALASTWRPNYIKLSLVFSVNELCK
jgi:hypothetical protein